METAVQRWEAIVKARAAQMDAAYARLGRTSSDFWDRRARGFHRSTRDTVRADPFYLRVHEVVTPRTSVLDVGAGTGRFTLALAPLARQVTAVEPNTAMLNYLQQDAHAQGLTNITMMQAKWEEAPADLQADIVLCSHVLYPILDIGPFLARLDAATQQACYLYLRATHIDTLTAPLWRHFHGAERCLPPGYVHALDVLYEMGIYANVEIAKQASPVLRFPSLDVAVDEMQEQLILPATDQVRHELRELLASWLVERDGMLAPPQHEMTVAIIWWTHQ